MARNRDSEGKVARPREGLVGAHTKRREPEAEPDSDAESEDDRDAEPFGSGATVAPTKKAEARERARHDLQRQQVVVPAGTEGNARQRRPDDVDRDALDAANDNADRAVTDRDNTPR